MVTQVDIGGGRGWLAPEAAASLARVEARLGRRLDVNEAGRTRARQQQLWNLYYYPNGTVRPASQRPSWLGRPAKPGYSLHETGLAVDTDDRIAWIREHGWVAEVKGEPWHFEYRANLDQHRSGGPAPAFPLAAGSYFGPKLPLSNKSSVSGYFGHGDDLKRWQLQMRARGWQLTADGRYGDQTRRIASAFQAEKGLRVDGLIGPATWAAAWTAPVS